MSRWLVPLAVVALVAAGVIWFLSTYERVPGRVWVGPSGEARRNVYLAAGRLAERMGLATRELRSLPELDTLSPDSVLLLPSRRQALDPRRLQDIVDWVESGGGHLIVEAELLGVTDPLFELLDISRAAAPAPAKPASIALPDGRRMTVSIFGAMTLQAGNSGAARYVSFDYGEGRVSALTGLQFARNQLLGDEDNAAFFWHLLRLTPAAELQVYLRPERLSLWGFLTQYAAPVLAAAVALLALWLWRIAPRFGPVRPDAPPARRRLLDHLRASGRFYWAQGLRGPLVVAARDAALRAIGRAQPDFPHSSDQARAARVAALAQIPEQEAQRFLSAAGSVRGADFIRIVHAAQRIHSALEKGNHGK
jgi:hypothetical protein